MIAIDIAAAVVVLIVVFFAAKHAARVANRKRLLAAGLPDEYARIIEKNVPLYTRLPDSVKRQLGGLINIFLAEKHYEGCGGLEITAEVKITLAAHASVPPATP